MEPLTSSVSYDFGDPIDERDLANLAVGAQ